MSTDHFFAIEIDPSGPFGEDSGMPASSSFLIRKDLAGRRSRPQHVQVMHFAEQILQIFQVVTPCQMQFGQKIFDSVAKTLYTHAQSLATRLRVLPHCRPFDLVGLDQTLESEIMQQATSLPH